MNYDKQTAKTNYPMNVETFIRPILSKISEKGKCYTDFMVHLFELFLSLRGKYTFLNMARWGNYVESTYRSNYAKEHELAAINKELIHEYLGEEKFWAFDPCYLSKSGKKTHGVGKFWSSTKSKSDWGLEIGSIACIDVVSQTALHYSCQQTLPGKQNKSLLERYADQILGQAESLQEISRTVVCDAFFSKKPFVDLLVDGNFEVISRFRHDVGLRYLYAGPQKGGKGKNLGKGKGSGGGRHKTYDGKINLKSPRPEYLQPCYQDESELGYEGVVYANALKRKVRIFLLHKLDEQGKIKKAVVYFSTDLNRPATDVYLYYKLRFQQEFLFRDAKQHLGLQDCQARSADKIDFHTNMSLTTLNIAKVIHYLPVKDTQKTFSMADIKTQYVNELLLDEAFDLFISLSGVEPNSIKNNKEVLQLYQKGKIAA